MERLWSVLLLTPVVIVLVALAGAFLFLLSFVIPQLVSIFQNAGLDLPWPTKISLGMYQWLIVYWPLSLGLLVSTLLGLSFYLKTEKGQYNKDYALLKLPILGAVFQKTAMSRFASIFSVLQGSGVSVLNALDILSGTMGNKVISREFERVQDELRQGQGNAGPLGKSSLFPSMVVNMVAIGEESGNLEEMLSYVSVHYDDEVDYAVSRMSENLGPVLIVALAAVVGFFALAIFLPMWDTTKMV